MKDNMFLKTTPFEDAVARLRKSTRPIEESEKIGLRESLKRVLSVDVRSPIDVPHFPRSSRDGYALMAVDTFNAGEDKPVILRLTDEVHIGVKPNLRLVKGECARISTGAMVPQGADSITMIENTEEENGQVKIYRPTSPGENIIEVGTDIKAGEVVLRQGERLTVLDLGVLASLGLSEVDVYRKPKIAIISTGNELLSAGRELEVGKVYDINSITIHEAVAESGGIPVDFGIIPDDLACMVEVANSAMLSSDIILFSGGTSKGPGDLLPAVVQKLGKPEFYIHGIAMKPGKPTILSSVKGKLLLTLPGYPTSSLIVYYVLVDPVIRKMAHEPPCKFQKVRAYTATRFYSEIGRREFSPCKISRISKDKIYVTPVLTGSESITTLTNADGFVIIPENVEFLDQNQEVEFYVFKHKSGKIRYHTGE